MRLFGMMNRNLHFRLDLGAGFDAPIAARKSRLMDATSFLVGTRFSISFLPFSMRGSQ